MSSRGTQQPLFPAGRALQVPPAEPPCSLGPRHCPNPQAQGTVSGKRWPLGQPAQEEVTKPPWEASPAPPAIWGWLEPLCCLRPVGSQSRRPQTPDQNNTTWFGAARSPGAGQRRLQNGSPELRKALRCQCVLHSPGIDITLVFLKPLLHATVQAGAQERAARGSGSTVDTTRVTARPELHSAAEQPGAGHGQMASGRTQHSRDRSTSPGTDTRRAAGHGAAGTTAHPQQTTPGRVGCLRDGAPRMQLPGRFGHWFGNGPSTHGKSFKMVKLPLGW